MVRPKVQTGNGAAKCGRRAAGFFGATAMKRNIQLICFVAAASAVMSVYCDHGPRACADSSVGTDTAQPVDLFDGVRDGQVDAKVVAINDHQARIFLTNNTERPLNIKLPEAFAAVPLAQFGGGGGGRAGGGGGGRSGGSSRSSSSGSSQSQSTGGGGGSGGGGGGGGFFSVPAEKTSEIDMATLCLDHGLRDPSSSMPYKLVPAEDHIDRPAVVELLKAFGRGDLNPQAAQAAAWHLNNDLSWDELAAKKQGTIRSFNRPPYFSADEMKTAMAYSGAAESRAAEAAKAKKAEKKEDKEKKSEPAPESDENSSESRSTQN
jgi:hypothetical protein